MTPVRNDGKCGARWAYSTVETIESMVAIKTNTLREYSIQQFKTEKSSKILVSSLAVDYLSTITKFSKFKLTFGN